MFKESYLQVHIFQRISTKSHEIKNNEYYHSHLFTTSILKQK